jgi:hypothetical protein
VEQLRRRGGHSVCTGPNRVARFGQGGTSYLLIDLHSEGIEVPPGARHERAHSRFCEAVLDDIRVPVINRVGQENNGWALARTTLGNERAARSLSQASAYRQRLDSLIGLLQSRHPLDDPLARGRLARCVIHVRLLYLNAVRETTTEPGTTAEPGPSSSVARLYFNMVEQNFPRSPSTYWAPTRCSSTALPPSQIAAGSPASCTHAERRSVPALRRCSETPSPSRCLGCRETTPAPDCARKAGLFGARRP